MKLQEGHKKAGFFKKHYAATVSLVVENEEDFRLETEEAISALHDWRSVRGPDAKEIWFIVVTDEPLNEFVRTELIRLFSETENAAVLVNAHDVTFEILNTDIEPVISFKIELVPERDNGSTQH